MCMRKRLCTGMSLHVRPPPPIPPPKTMIATVLQESKEKMKKKCCAHRDLLVREREKKLFLLLLSHKQPFWTPLSLGILCPTWDRCTWACMSLGGYRSAFPLAIEENVHFNWVPTESWWKLSQSPALTDGSLFLPSPAVTLGRTGWAAAV